MPDCDTPSPFCRPLVKWPGGKTRELGEIAAVLPDCAGRFIEPFLGGGAVFWSLTPSIARLGNDRSRDLMAWYRHCQDGTVLEPADALASLWDATRSLPVDADTDALVSEVTSAAARYLSAFDALFVPRLERTLRSAFLRKGRLAASLRANGILPDYEALGQTAIMGGLYTAARLTGNTAEDGPWRSALFWMVRDFSYGAMHRVNGAGEFNVAYGGATYNARRFRARVNQLLLPETAAVLRNSRFTTGVDFEQFLEEAEPGRRDTVFLDPPYDSRFATYDGNAFGRSDHQRLATWMDRTTARVVMVIADTPFVRETYGVAEGSAASFAKSYSYGIKGRFDRRARHLVITRNLETHPAPVLLEGHAA